MWIVEFVLAIHWILTQWQGKQELPDSPQLLHRDITVAIGIPIYAKSTIERLQNAWYVLTLSPMAIFWQLVRYFRQTVSCCHFFTATFILLEGLNWHHDNNWGSRASGHLISPSSLFRYDMRRLIDGKFRGFASKIDGSTCIWMFRGGRRQNSRSSDSKF